MSWFRRLFGGVSRALVAAAIEVAVAIVKEKLDKNHRNKDISASQLAVAKTAVDEVAVAIENEVARRL